MKPVMQTALGLDGNCFAACLASLFDLGIDDLPNFVAQQRERDGSDWAVPVREWLRARGFGIVMIGLNGDESVLRELGGFYIVSGQSVPGVWHATLWSGGRLVHDPHPSQCGIRSPEVVDLLYPLDPSALSLKEPA